MATYYLDTSIWLDHYENRGANGEYAQILLHKIAGKHDVVLWSIVHLTEFRDLGYSKLQVDDIFRVVRPLMQHIHLYSEQILEGLQIKGHLDIPLNDILHAITARDSEATLIARDRHFERLRFITPARLPEELI